MAAYSTASGPKQERVKVAGAGLHMKPASARHTEDAVMLTTLLKAGPAAGTVVELSAPKLTVEEGKAWVTQRIEGFETHLGARESVGDALRRKALAGQGEGYVKRLRATLDKRGRAELDMMLSPDSHAQAMDPHEAGEDLVRVTIGRDGAITGLAGDRPLVDSEGTQRAARKEA